MEHQSNPFLSNDQCAERHSVVTADLLRALQRSESTPVTWTTAKMLQAIERYVRFLRLAAANQDGPVAPTRDIDLVWHLHMQHPVAYHRDCLALFGRIFDHDGGFGADASELPELQRCFDHTAQLWMQAYGEDYRATQDADASPVNCWHDCEGRCWHACSEARS